MKIWLKALRVNQWTKNAVVFAAWFFAVADASQAAMARGFRPFLLVCAMAAAFALVSSAFYLLNDVSDYDADRLHPVKRLRPIAADLISKIDAVRAALAMFALGLAFPCYLVFRHPDRTWGFGVILVYTLMQCAYSGFLKRVPYVDVAVIAAGFVLRAVAGAAAMGVRISPWLLVVLDILIGLSAVGTLGVYMCYTLAADTVARFHTRGLAATGLFVALGIARYIFLMRGRGDVGRPEKVLLSDRLLWAILFGYGATAVAAVLLARL